MWIEPQEVSGLPGVVRGYLRDLSGDEHVYYSDLEGLMSLLRAAVWALSDEGKAEPAPPGA